MNMVYGRRKGLEGAEKARRAMAQEIWSKPPPTGFYVSEQGCKKIQERQQKLIQKAGNSKYIGWLKDNSPLTGVREVKNPSFWIHLQVPPKKWKAREKLKEGRRDRMFGLIEKLCNSARIMNSLRPDGIEPSSWLLGFSMVFLCLSFHPPRALAIGCSFSRLLRLLPVHKPKTHFVAV